MAEKVVATVNSSTPTVKPAGDPMVKPDERTSAMFCHLSTLVGLVFPFGNLIAPLIIWQVKKKESTFVDDQGKEVVNFQITLTIYYIVAAALTLVLIGLLLLMVLVVFSLIVTIIGALKANEGIAYRYPLNIRFIK